MKFLTLLAVLIGSTLPAQTLTVNGSTGSALVPLGSTMTLEFSGTPGMPHLWFVSTDPGPTTIFGVPYAFGFAGALEIGGLAPLPPSGVRTLSFTVSVPAAFTGLPFYSLAGVLDPGVPNGVGISNAISFTFVVPGTDAGPDAAVMTDAPVTLDGSANLDPSGAIPAGTSLAWILTEAPGGSTPTLDHATSAFPVFRTDTAGHYVIELQKQNAAGFGADRVDLDAYALTPTGWADGQFGTSPVHVTGTLAGPGPQLDVNGTPVPVAGGSFDAGNIALANIMNPVHARVTAPSGAATGSTASLIQGASAPLGVPASPAAIARLQGAALDALEAPIAAAIAAIPLGQLITSLPPTQVINSPPFITATIAFTGASYDPTVIVDLYPSNGAIGISVTLTNLVITADLTGVLLFVPYAETATMSADSVTVTSEMVVGANAQGAIEITMQNTATTFVNFQLTATGVLSGLGQLAAIQQAAQDLIGAAFSGVMALLPPAINPLLAGLNASIDLSSAGIPLILDLPFHSASYDLNGITIALGVLTTPTSTAPGAPALTDYLVTAGGLPTFGATTPAGGLPFTYAAGFNDDFLNQALATTTLTGFFDQELTAIAGPARTAGELDLLSPGAGFDVFDPASPATIRTHATTAPVVAFTPGNPDIVTLHAGNIELEALVESAPGVAAPILRAGLTFFVDLAVSLDPNQGTLVLTPGTAQVQATWHGGLAGQDASATLQGLGTIVQQLLPGLLAPLSAIPLPAIGGATAIEVSLPPGAPDTLIVYLQ